MSNSDEFGFNPDRLTGELKPLVPGAPAGLSAPEEAYLRHYGIHFAEEVPNLTHQFGVIDGGGHRLAVHLWTPQDSTGTALVIHGYYDHVGLYRHLIGHLIGRRVAVLTLDLPGHGLSSGARATIDTFDHYVDAVDACLQALAAHLPRPWHLVGQSMGGAIAMEWLLAKSVTRATSPFAGIILLAPLVRPYLWPINRVFYELIRRFVSQRPRTFADNSEDLEFLEFLRDRDPLQARILPVRWVTAMVAWKKRFVRYRPSDLSVLVVQGGSDRTVDSHYDLKVIQRLFDAKVLYIPEARHHLVNETATIRGQMLAAIDEELDLRTVEFDLDTGSTAQGAYTVHPGRN
ncbi:MAG: alpha/beta hydrolase [Pseudomonadales bacterium]